MSVLSFDVGQKNLAYCKLCGETNEILDWNVITLPTSGVPCVIKALERAFPKDSELTTVIVEKQPSRNIKMRIIETVLLSYFATIGVKTTISYSAKHKLGTIGKTMKGKTNYTMRKKMSVLMCKTYLAQTTVNDTVRSTFERSKKQDDLADCLLQYLAYTGMDTSSLTTRVVDLMQIPEL